MEVEGKQTGKAHTHEHTHTHTHTLTHARTHARTHTHTHARTHARTHAHTHTETHTHQQKGWLTDTRTYAQTLPPPPLTVDTPHAHSNSRAHPPHPPLDPRPSSVPQILHAECNVRYTYDPGFWPDHVTITSSLGCLLLTVNHNTSRPRTVNIV